MRRLEKIIQETEAESTQRMDSRLLGPQKTPSFEAKGGTANPWTKGSPTFKALQTFPSRIKDVEVRTKLEKLMQDVEGLLGSEAVDVLSGVYNPARLYRYLCANDMDVRDARSMVVMNSNARVEFKMDARRKRIVEQNLSFPEIPRASELSLLQCQSRFKLSQATHLV